MRRQLQRLFIALLCLGASTVTLADVDLMPRNGISMYAMLGALSQESVVLKPDSSQTSAVRYHLQSLKSGGYAIDSSRLKVKTLYTVGSESLDYYRTFLSGKESGQQVTAIFEFQPTWEDRPGIYTGRVISSSSVPEIPVEITILPKSLISLNPPSFQITPSTIEAPIITEVNVLLGSNSPRWELYVVAGDLAREKGKEAIETDRVFVRVKDELNPKSWTALTEPFQVVSGSAGPMRTVATLQFAVESERADPAGNYTGDIRILVRNMQ